MGGELRSNWIPTLALSHEDRSKYKLNRPIGFDSSHFPMVNFEKKSHDLGEYPRVLNGDDGKRNDEKYKWEADIAQVCALLFLCPCPKIQFSAAFLFVCFVFVALSHRWEEDSEPGKQTPPTMQRCVPNARYQPTLILGRRLAPGLGVEEGIWLWVFVIKAHGCIPSLTILWRQQTVHCWFRVLQMPKGSLLDE